MSAYYYHSHDPLVVTAVHIALRCVQTLCAHAYVRCETCTLASHVVTGVLACDARARVSQRFIYTPDFLLSVTISRRSMTMFLSADMASTKAKHPRVLQKPCSSKMNASDKLRRMAIKNSFVAQSQYQSPVETPQNDLRQGTFLPPLCQKQMLVTPAAVGNRKQYSTNSLILDVPCVRDDPHTTLSHGLSRQSHYAAGRHSPLTEYESMLWSSYVHSTSDMNMGSGTLERCSSHRNLAARRTNETVRAGYRSANCQMKNDFEPMQRRASSCFNVAVLKPNATVHQRARTRSPAPVPPCSTTTLDFAVCQHLVRQSSSNMVRRVNTPRGNNPHPTGLEFQSPYNRECKTFEIWNPDIGLVENRLPHMLKHIDNTNFTSGKTNPFFQEKDSLPVVHYSKASMYRCYYQRPQEAHGYDVTVPTTRFGSSPNKRPAVGIVPNAISQRVPVQRQPVRLHLPRSYKMASLV